MDKTQGSKCLDWIFPKHKWCLRKCWWIWPDGRPEDCDHIWWLKIILSETADLFVCDRELNMSTVLIIHSHLWVPEDIRINLAQYVIMNIPNTRYVQQIAYKNANDIDSKEFIKSYKNTNQKLHWFVIHSKKFLMIFSLQQRFYRDKK